MITPIIWNPGLCQSSIKTSLHFSRTKPESKGPNMNCELYAIKKHRIIKAGSYIIQDISGVLYVVHYNKKSDSWDKDPLYNPETGKANFKPII